ncbi:MAG: hypothetical protein AB1540_12285 [Bdellovibrionota bacterium]
MRKTARPRLVQFVLFWVIILQLSIGSVVPVLAADFKDPGSGSSDHLTKEIQELSKELEVEEQASPEISEEKARQDAESLHQRLAGSKTHVRNRLDTFGLLDLDLIEHTHKTVRVDGLQLRWSEQAVASEQSVSQKRTGVSQFKPVFDLFSNEPRHFEVVYQGQTIFRSAVTAQAAVLNKGYLVFIEPGSFSEGVQHLSFIDLKFYEAILAQQTPPIFTAPIATESASTGLRATNDGIIFENQAGGSGRVPFEVLEGYSNAHKLAMDVTANILDPKSYESMQPAVEEMERYLKKAANIELMDGIRQFERTQEFYADMHKSLQNRYNTTVPKVKNLAALGEKNPHEPGSDQWTVENQNKLQSYEFFLKGDSRLAESTRSLQASLLAQRKLGARLHLIWQRLSLPQPYEAPMRIREALAMVAAGLSKGAAGDAGSVREGVLQLVNNPYVKWGAGVAAAGTLGALYPEVFSHFVYETLDMANVGLRTMLGKTRDVFGLLGEATTTTLSGFYKPALFYQTYLSDGKYLKFAAGLAGFLATGLAIVATPVFTVSAWKLVRDLKVSMTSSPGPGQGVLGQAEGASLSFLERLVASFVERQRTQLTAYLKGQRVAFEKMAEHHGQAEKHVFTTKDDQYVERRLRWIEQKNSLFFKSMFGRVDAWGLFRKVQERGAGSSAEGEGSGTESKQVLMGHDAHPQIDVERVAAEKQIYNFKTALVSFLASYASLTDAFGSIVHSWNGFTIFRRVFWSPSLWVIQTIYPNFTNVALGDGSQHQLIPPSKANGGLLNTLEVSVRLAKFLGFSSDLEAVHAWESKILPVEQAISAVAIREAYSALVRFTAEDGSAEDLAKLIKLGAPQHLTDKRLTDKKIQKLVSKQRSFFRYLVDQLSSRALQRYLVELTQKVGRDQPADATISELKKITLDQANALTIDSSEAERLVSEELKSGEAYSRAKRIVESWHPSAIYQRAETNLRHRSLGIVDPKYNPTMGRIQVVLEMLQKPESLPRAVRSTLSGLLMEKTIGLGMALFALAGIQGGVMQPFYPDAMFGPDSYFYMGRMPFVNGLLMGLVVGVFANVWVKLQVDSQHSDHFGEVPEGAQKKWSYARWFGHQTFKNPNNTFWGNQKSYWKIIWGNMKPAFVLMLFQGLLSLGRFDLDGYVVGYLIAYLNPLNGFNQKVEQGNEFASFYHLKDIPKKYRSHPRVQQYIARKQQSLRFYFAIWEKFFVDLQGAIIGNFARMASVTYGGTEALSRILFGMTPTVGARMGLEWARENIGFVPGVNFLTKACDKLLTNNYNFSNTVPPPKGKQD